MKNNSIKIILLLLAVIVLNIALYYQIKTHGISDTKKIIIALTMIPPIIGLVYLKFIRKREPED